MKLRSEVAALVIPLTFALSPIVGMVLATQSMLLPPFLSIVRMFLIVGVVVVAVYTALRQGLTRTAATDVLGLALLLVSLYPLANSLAGPLLAVTEFQVASMYLALCGLSVLVPLRLANRQQQDLFQLLGVIAAVFLGFSTAFLGWAYWIRQPYSAATGQVVERLGAPLVLPASVSRGKPDVFHLILDGMGRPDVLERRYGMRLDATLQRFRELGFQIEPGTGYANYIQTHLSISSMLNMTYLDELSGPQRSTNNREPLRRLIAQAKVPRAFRQLEYSIEFIGGGALPEAAFEGVDVCDCPQLWFFEPELGAVTLTPFKLLLGLGFGHHAYFNRALGVFQAFERRRTGTAPRYVYAHVTLPHPPFVADERGTFHNPGRALSGADGSFYPGTTDEYVGSYRKQATFVLSRTLEAVTRVLNDARHDGREVIVIVTGDHGPRLGLDAVRPTAESGRFTLPTWLAIRWPPDMHAVDSPQSLVNVYRELFSQVFGMALPPLPNRAYVSGFSTPYEFVESLPASE
jgi:hypothetical protein